MRWEQRIKLALWILVLTYGVYLVCAGAMHDNMVEACVGAFVAVIAGHEVVRT